MWGQWLSSIISDELEGDWSQLGPWSQAWHFRELKYGDACPATAVNGINKLRDELVDGR